jgi:hypothetical protein
METFEGLSVHIQDHVKQITKSSGLPASDENHELMAKAWVEKSDCFLQNMAENKLEEVTFFSRDEPRGALLLTYSGSLLTIGPLVDGIRRCEYTSIGLRTDVPASAVEEASVLSSDFELDEVAGFSKGPIKKSSPLFKIAMSKDVLEPEEEEALLTQISQAVAEDFVEVNKTVIQ